MSEFFGALLFLGPMLAVGWTLAGVLIPGAIAVGLFSISRCATPILTVAFGGICLLITAAIVSPDALFVVSTSVSFAVQSFAAAWLCRRLRRFDHWLESRERERV